MSNYYADTAIKEKKVIIQWGIMIGRMVRIRSDSLEFINLSINR